MESRKHSFRLLWLLPVLLLAGMGVMAFLHVKQDQSNLQKALDRAKKLDLATDLSIFKSNVPDDQNAALHTGITYMRSVGFDSPYVKTLQTPIPTFKELETKLSPFTSKMAQVEAASKLPYWAPKRNYSKPSMTLYPEFASIKEYTRMFSFRAELEWHKGQPDLAEQDLLTAARLANLMRQDHTMIGYLVEVACSSIVHLSTARIVIASDGSPAAVKLQSKVESALLPADYHHALSTELACEVIFADSLNGQDTLKNQIDMWQQEHVPFHTPVNIAKLKTLVINYFCDLDENAASHPDDLAARYKAHSSIKEPTAPQYTGEGVYIGLMLPIFADALRAGMMDEEKGQILTVATQILAYKRAHGTLPKSLADLPKTVDTIDPFTRKPFLYKKTKDKFVVWSVGTDGIDDTGGVVPATTNPSDIMFQTVDDSRPPLIGR